MILAMKALHIAAVIVWCAGLIALPLMLRHLEPEQSQFIFTKLRKVTHYGYTYLMTPAAVIAVSAGIALIFLRQTYTGWMIGKLAAVGLLACVHGFQGHVVLRSEEEKGGYDSPRASLLIVPALLTITLVLLIVLAKPEVPASLFPDWLTLPRHRQLPWDEVPS